MLQSLFARSTQAVTRYSYGKEVGDLAIGPACGGSLATRLTFDWYGGVYHDLVSLESGTIVVQGNFPALTAHPLVWIPWPILVTTRIRLGSEGTTFSVYSDEDQNHNGEDYVFLFDGGPLDVEGLNALPLSFTAYANDDLHRRIVADATQVMYVLAHTDNGTLKITAPAPVPTTGSAHDALECVKQLRHKTGLDHPMGSLR